MSGLNKQPEQEAPKSTSTGETIVSLVLLVVLGLMVKGCLFSGSEESAPVAPTQQAISTGAGAAVGSVSQSASTAVPNSTPTAVENTRTGSTALEQAIFDAFPVTPPKSKSARKEASNAADFVGATINLSGHLCSHPVEAQKASWGQYGVRCIKHKGSYEVVDYLIDVRSGSISEI